MDFYLWMFFVSFILSLIFSLGWIGFAVAFVPILDFFGIWFNQAKAIGLFLNSLSTGISSLMNFLRKQLDIKFVLLLTVFSIAGSVFGGYFSKYFSIFFLKSLFVIFLFFSAFMMIYWKKRKGFIIKNNIFLSILGLIVWFISGLLWVGGGAILVPVLVLVWYDIKKVALNISFVIALSTFAGFLTYSTYVHLDYILLWITAIWSLLWGYIGNWILHYKLDKNKVKKILAILLVILAFKMLFSLFK